MASQAAALLEDESDFVANAANFAAFVYHEIPDLNWAGFYFPGTVGELVLGPFNGRPACTRLAPGRGVCGAAFTSGKTVVVDDVHAFADHIACDSASASEIVVPLRVGDEIFGVFDIDSPSVARFSAEDRAGIEKLVEVFVSRVRSASAAVCRALSVPNARASKTLFADFFRGTICQNMMLRRDFVVFASNKNKMGRM